MSYLLWACCLLFLLSCSSDELSSSVASPRSPRIEEIPTKNQTSSSGTNVASTSSKVDDGIAYGQLLDSRDGKSYRTVQIGEQVWMAQNLDYVDSAKTPSLKGHAWCVNEDSLQVGGCGAYGMLYSWAAAIDSVEFFKDSDSVKSNMYVDVDFSGEIVGICPEGWRLPSKADYWTLAKTLGGLPYAGDPLKSPDGEWEKWGGSNSSGFSVLPVGYRFREGEFREFGKQGLFLTSSAAFTDYCINGSSCVADNVQVFAVRDEFVNVGFEQYHYDEGFSIRCIQE